MLTTWVDLPCSDPGELALEVEGQLRETEIYASVVSILAYPVFTNLKYQTALQQKPFTPTASKKLAALFYVNYATH